VRSAWQRAWMIFLVSRCDGVHWQKWSINGLLDAPPGLPTAQLQSVTTTIV